MQENNAQEIVNIINDSIEVKKEIIHSTHLLQNIEKAAGAMIEAFHNKSKILICGNGGSASDALHIEGELVGRFQRNRKALPAIALVASPATLTAIANDYSYDSVFERQLEAHGIPGDILMVLSTSGNSRNVVIALRKAKQIGMKTIVLTGKNGGCSEEYADILLNVPSEMPPRIQESHILIGHILCDLCERAFVKK